MINHQRLESEAAYEIGMLLANDFCANGLLSEPEFAQFQQQLQRQEKPLVGCLDSCPMEWISSTK